RTAPAPSASCCAGGSTPPSPARRRPGRSTATPGGRAPPGRRGARPPERARAGPDRPVPAGRGRRRSCARVLTPPRPGPHRLAPRLPGLATAVAGRGAARSAGDAAAPAHAPEDAVPPDATEAALADRDDPLPVVTPTPRTMRWLGPDVPVPPQVAVRPSPGVDDATLAAVTEALTAAGATDVAVEDAEGAADEARGDDRPALTVLVGGVDDAPLAEALAGARLEVPAELPAEGYALAAYGRSDGTGTIALAGADAAGTFYAAQTL